MVLVDLGVKSLVTLVDLRDQGLVILVDLGVKSLIGLLRVSLTPCLER